MQEHILAVQKMQDYIQQNINQNITLSDLAKTSLFSPWYSYRLFQSIQLESRGERGYIELRAVKRLPEKK